MCSVALEQQLRPRGELLLQEFEVRILKGCVQGKPRFQNGWKRGLAISRSSRSRADVRVVRTQE
jgi:hypothetical protein